MLQIDRKRTARRAVGDFPLIHLQPAMAAAYSEPYKELEEERCRLCLEGEYDGPLVQPCACRGSIKWIHEHCLE